MSNWLDCVNGYVKKSEIVAVEIKRMENIAKEPWYRIVLTTRHGIQITYAWDKNRTALQDEMIMLAQRLDIEE